MRRQVKSNAGTEQSACRSEIPGEKPDGDFSTAHELCDKTVAGSVDNRYCIDFCQRTCQCTGNHVHADAD